MGKNAQRRRDTAPAKQPEVDHFILGTNAYIDIRRYLGSRPHDETRQLIQLLEQLPVVTKDDVAKDAERAERLEELEKMAAESAAQAAKLAELEDADLDEVRRLAAAGEPLISVESHDQEGGVTAGVVNGGGAGSIEELTDDQVTELDELDKPPEETEPNEFGDVDPGLPETEATPGDGPDVETAQEEGA